MMRGGLLAWCWILAIGCGSSEQNSGDDDDARGGSGGSAVGAGGSAGASTPTAGAAGSATASGGQAGGPTNAGSGGTATAGSNGGGNAATSGSAGSSGSAGGERPDPSSASELDACLYYLRSVCNRQFNECNERPAELHPCPDVEQTCPDRYFSDGSEFTVASLIACGDYWRTRSCDEIASGVDPACLTRGSLLLAEPCTFSTQCASLWCYAPTSGTCGVCVEERQEGESCGTEVEQCAGGLTCSSGICAVPPETTRYGAGQACPSPGPYTCIDGLSCMTLPGQAGPTCQPEPMPGQPCADDWNFCSGGGFCNASRQCQAVPGAGMPCGVTLSGVTLCDANSFCPPSEGSSTEPRLCLAPAGLGRPCSTSQDLAESKSCEQGLSCHCVGAACSAGTGTCVQLRNPGEPCASGNDLCLANSRCQDGVCVDGGGLQGLYATTCGD